MPFPDGSFQLVVFDPPHVVREKQPPEGINGLKYGALHPESEQDDLRRGFAECWRVLAPGGTLVFKWGAGSLARVEPHFPAPPIVGTRTPRGGQTRWLIFYKPLADPSTVRVLLRIAEAALDVEAYGVEQMDGGVRVGSQTFAALREALAALRFTPERFPRWEGSDV